MTQDTISWSKPARERHAHVGERLQEVLEGASGAAKDLALYLFRNCIAGKLEEIELYKLSLGSGRLTSKRNGKPYAPNTLRLGLQKLVEMGLVIIDREFRGGIFRLTVCHPGPTRPFVKNLQVPEKFRTSDRKFDESGLKNLDPPFSFTEDLKEKAEAPAAAPLNSLVKEIKKETSTKDKIFFTDNPSPCGLGESKPPSSGGGGVNVRTHGSPCGNKVDLSGTKDLCPQEAPARPSPPSVLVEEEEEGEPKVINLEEGEILSAIREVIPLNPQIRKEVINFTLLEVKAAINLYHERKTRKAITNPEGFIIEALRGKWAVSNSSEKTLDNVGFNTELTVWYEWATIQGIVDGRALRHCATDSYREVLVSIVIPPEKRRGGEAPFILMPWREAIATYPMENDQEPKET